MPPGRARGRARGKETNRLSRMRSGTLLSTQSAMHVQVCGSVAFRACVHRVCYTRARHTLNHTHTHAHTPWRVILRRPLVRKHHPPSPTKRPPRRRRCRSKRCAPLRAPAILFYFVSKLRTGDVDSPFFIYYNMQTRATTPPSPLPLKPNLQTYTREGTHWCAWHTLVCVCRVRACAGECGCTPGG
jgi:hypothetical protein